MLLPYYHKGKTEAGCDEAGRGCLAGPVYAAAVILPPDYRNEALNDSKQLTEKKRYELREQVERDAIAWAVGVCSAQEIDKINILHASYLAMHRAIDRLGVRPETLIIDGNRFDPYYPTVDHSTTDCYDNLPLLYDCRPLPYATIIKGDGKYLSIAAASILAKTYRDDFMNRIAAEYPQYDWLSNKGYPTRKHRQAIAEHGLTPYHRTTFRMQ